MRGARPGFQQMPLGKKGTFIESHYNLLWHTRDHKKMRALQFWYRTRNVYSNHSVHKRIQHYFPTGSYAQSWILAEHCSADEPQHTNTQLNVNNEGGWGKGRKGSEATKHVAPQKKEKTRRDCKLNSSALVKKIFLFLQVQMLGIDFPMWEGGTSGRSISF